MSEKPFYIARWIVNEPPPGFDSEEAVAQCMALSELNTAGVLEALCVTVEDLGCDSLQS